MRPIVGRDPAARSNHTPPQGQPTCGRLTNGLWCWLVGLCRLNQEAEGENLEGALVCETGAEGDWD